MSDKDTLLAMGFDPERVDIAIKKTGNLNGAIDWLEKNQDKSIDDIKGADAPDDEEAADALAGMPSLAPGEEAKSLVCDDCGKKFRNEAQAQWHASKTEHSNFSQSTEEIAPLTEDEKKAKLQELREKLAAKRAGQSAEDAELKKKNDAIRKMATRESQDIKEDLQKKEQIKEAELKRKEKRADVDARQKILMQIEKDKEERRRKNEIEKAQRAGTALPPQPEPVVAAAPKKAASEYTEARLRLQTPNGTVQKSFPVTTTLFEVAHALQSENGTQAQSFTTNFPKKTFDTTDFGMTLKEAGLVPSAALIVK